MVSSETGSGQEGHPSASRVNGVEGLTTSRGSGSRLDLDRHHRGCEN
jgi:hypothetical protein